MTTQKILGCGLILTCLAAGSPAYSQGRGNGNRFSGNNFGGGRIASPPSLQGSRPIDTSKFRTIAPNQAGANAPVPFQAAPNQGGNNAPNAARSFAPSQPGANQPGINTPSIGGGSTQFAGFGNGFGGFSQPRQTQPSFQQTFASSTPPAAAAPNQPGLTSQFSSRSFTDFGVGGGQTAAATFSTPRASVSQQTAFSPVRPPLAQQTFSQGPIRIILPKNYPLGVNYVLNDFTYSMQPGQQQRFAEDREWVLRFDRGLNLGTQEYALTPGTYAFVCGSTTGWELYRVSNQQAELAIRN